MTYNEKSNDSFDARLRFYLFYCALQGNEKEVDKSEFLAFDIDVNPALAYVNLYITEYQQFERDYVIEIDDNKKDNDDIYKAMEALTNTHTTKFNTWRADYKEQEFSKKMPVKEFETYEKVNNCYYCGISKDEIEELATKKQLFKKTERGFNLELDRKSPNMEYSFENCVMACYWCNNAKTDEFTAEEFAPIGEAIGKALKSRLTKS